MSLSLTLLLGTVSSVFSQSSDVGSDLEKAEKSLNKHNNWYGLQGAGICIRPRQQPSVRAAQQHVR